MMLALLILQVAQPAQAAQQPDIQLEINATARRVVVENRGRASLTLRTSVNGGDADGGNLVQVDAPELPQGRRELRNVNVRVRAETRLADPQDPRAQPQEPATPQ